MQSLIVDSMSQHDCHGDETSTESRIQAMGCEISSAAAHHRHLVNELLNSSHDGSDRQDDSQSADTQSGYHSSDTRSPSVSSSAD